MFDWDSFALHQIEYFYMLHSPVDDVNDDDHDDDDDDNDDDDDDVKGM